jgi:hypothetical protein
MTKKKYIFVERLLQISTESAVFPFTIQKQRLKDRTIMLIHVWLGVKLYLSY